MATEREFRIWYRGLAEQVRAHVPIRHLRRCMDDGMANDLPLEDYTAKAREYEAEMETVWNGEL